MQTIKYCCSKFVRHFIGEKKSIIGMFEANIIEFKLNDSVKVCAFHFSFITFIFLHKLSAICIDCMNNVMFMCTIEDKKEESVKNEWRADKMSVRWMNLW